MSADLNDRMTPNQSNGAVPNLTGEPSVQVLNIDEFGVQALLWRDRGSIVVNNRDGTELFSFGANACPFQPEPIKFLVSIYKVGVDRGKAIGREATKMRLREVLGSEL